MTYLDNAATTRVCAPAIEAVDTVLRQHFGNASALYDLGLAAHKILEHARAVLAAALGCAPGEVYFTGSGTEANNLAVLGAARARKAWGNEIVVTGYEHPSVAHAVDALEKEGFIVHRVLPSVHNRVHIGEMAQLVKKNTALVACMQVNNETGALLDVAALAKEVAERNSRTAVHCDAVQGFLKHPLEVKALHTAAISAHKVHGPKGIGALVVRGGMHLEPVIYGGGQERGLRSGTENVAYAAGFAAAVEDASARPLQILEPLAAQLRAGLAQMDGVTVNTPDEASPSIVNFSMPGFKSETLLHFLEAQKIYVSSGSACGRGERSRTLEAMGLPDAVIDSALRVSFDAGNNAADVEALLAALAQARQILVRGGGR